MVRKRPATGALSPSPADVVADADADDDDDGTSFRCACRSASVDGRGVVWAVVDDSDSALRFSCAIAETAASTFFSNSSSLTVKLVRSSVSMNWRAPDYVCQSLTLINKKKKVAVNTHQRRKIITRFSTQLVLVAETQNVLNIGNQMLWVRLQHYIN